MLYRIAGSCWSFLFVLVIAGLLHADIIRFKDGTELYGQIIAETDDSVMIQIEGGKAQKISRQQIQEIIKEDHLEDKNGLTEKRFRISDIGKVAISDLESEIDLWLQKMEPLRRSQAKKLVEAQKAARLGRTEVVYIWLSWWCKSGFLSVGEDDLDDTIAVLRQCKTKIEEDIHTLDRRSKCRGCHGKGLKKCRTCDGSGKVRDDIKRKKPKYIGFKKITVLKKVIKRCLDCKGKGTLECDGGAHEPEKRVKAIGGSGKMVEIEIAAKKHRSTLNTIKNEIRQDDMKRLRKLAERCRREKYYYLTLQILQRLNKKAAQ